ncbi:LysM peptidoglycan-binding domain-containing protein [Caenimonas sedimenti]|uniref:LysM peptidoglycan-binding domain-containing protein n=1 Tax=Caenimonas sedimenti TaxID=2596921 RepID=A0A562ZMD6_9BURK|nr:LysM domain-containing protein [Caenimonas sedimenti]TWO69663.1 LysM peptidoglycan-binding domain-containing protein [Caenimonas sedimenti]
MVPSKAAFGPVSRVMAAWAVLALGGLATVPAAAQNLPITPAQRSTAEQVAVGGIPLAELSPDAPDNYTVKSGDTLWGISGLYLKQPWRWPELWGMNMEQIKNPHRIFPGQQLYLEKADGLARLRMGQAPTGAPTDTVRVSPRVRIAGLPDNTIPTLPAHLIEPFLNEAIIVGAGELDVAPRIVAGPDDRVMVTRGDRAYVRGRTGTPLVERDPRKIDEYRIFRSATPLKDPLTGTVLGYEAQYLGAAELVRSESIQQVRNAKGGTDSAIVPATIDITRAREEMRIGDRLLPEPARQLTSYVPRAAAPGVEGTIVSIYGNAVALAGQNQVVAINKGAADGLESGQVLAILSAGRRVDDRSINSERTLLKLPDERNGLMMVFRTFDKLSYALILEITDTVKIGDRVASPR